MKITISERLRPFCHLPGTSCVIPWSSWKVQAFPTLLKFENLITGEKKEDKLPWKGPVLDFTIELDLEKGVVWVFGHTLDGYRRHKIEMPEIPVAALERLSLGMHKTLDWELVKRRRDLKEILPVWFRLGQMVPEAGKKVGAAALLKEYGKMEVCEAYLKMFLAGFEGILTPRLSDPDHQGIIAEGNFSESPLVLLREGARLIRSLFFTESKESWSFLPCLPPEFHAGRLLDLQTELGDKIDLEWSKKLLKRVIITPAVSREIFIHLQKPLQSFRAEKGERQTIERSLKLEAGKRIYLDRFEK